MAETREAGHMSGSDPAFPVNPIHFAEAPALFGLTKRELFAAMVMNGMLAGLFSQKGEFRHSDIAYASIQYADALLEELEKKA